MKYKYFISYVFKKRFRWGVGSAFVETNYELNDKSHIRFCEDFSKTEKMKFIVLLNYKEIAHPTEKGR